MTLKQPLFMQASVGDPAISFSALDMRALVGRLFHAEGVLSPDVVAGSLKVTQRGAGANFSVDVAAGACAIAGDDVALQGYYVCESDAVANVTIPSPPASGSRTHRVVARVKDALHTGVWSTYEWTIEVLQDTGSGTPAVPASAIGLARVAVVAGQSSVTNANITDDRPSATLITSRYPLVSADSARPPAPQEAEMTWRTDTKMLEVYNGSAWRAIPTAPGPDLWVRKTGDTTRNNTATVANDPHLTVALAANATYIVDAFLIYSSPTNVPDIKIGFAVPAGATLKWAPIGLEAATAAGVDAGNIRYPLETTSTRTLGTTGDDVIATPRGIIRTSSSTGSLVLQWAQSTATAENTVVRTDSWLRARRVA